MGRKRLEDFFRSAGAYGYAIYGHTDSRASDEYNMRLSQRRAEFGGGRGQSVGAVVERDIGFGERRPIALECHSCRNAAEPSCRSRVLQVDAMRTFTSLIAGAALLSLLGACAETSGVGPDGQPRLIARAHDSALNNTGVLKDGKAAIVIDPTAVRAG